VGCITITDHDTISGARAMAAAAGPGLKVIVGEEVSTTGGHLIGLFLHEEIEPGLSPRQTALEIKRQGGLVVIPHPFNWMFGCGLCGRLAEVIDLADAVEVCNAQNFWSVPNLRAERFARVHKFPAVVGVDIHHGDDLDACYQMMPAFHGPSQFLTSLRQAALVRGRHRPSYFIKTAWHVFLDRSGLGMPAGFGARATRRRRPAKPGPVAAMVPVKRG
jgi:predicted metal-dependent phosphoesterase TrpH